MIFILVLYWRIYQTARKRINKRKINSAPERKKNKKSQTSSGKRLSSAKFRFKRKIPKEELESSVFSEAVSKRKWC